jgi:hypothetical protein
MAGVQSAGLGAEAAPGDWQMGHLGRRNPEDEKAESSLPARWR